MTKRERKYHWKRKWGKWLTEFGKMEKVVNPQMFHWISGNTNEIITTPYASSGEIVTVTIKAENHYPKPQN